MISRGMSGIEIFREIVEESVDPVVINVTMNELEKVDSESVEVFKEEYEGNLVQLTFGYDGFSVNIGNSKQEMSNQDFSDYELEYSDLSDGILKNYYYKLM